MKAPALTTRPAYHKHDCEDCIRMASLEIGAFQVDVYECPEQSAIVRYGPMGEYWSAPLTLMNNPDRYPFVLRGANGALWNAVKQLTTEVKAL